MHHGADSPILQKIAISTGMCFLSMSGYVALQPAVCTRMRCVLIVKWVEVDLEFFK